jgi:hypothetical protein
MPGGKFRVGGIDANVFNGRCRRGPPMPLLVDLQHPLDVPQLFVRSPIVEIPGGNFRRGISRFRGRGRPVGFPLNERDFQVNAAPRAASVAFFRRRQRRHILLTLSAPHGHLPSTVRSAVTTISKKYQTTLLAVYGIESTRRVLNCNDFAESTAKPRNTAKIGNLGSIERGFYFFFFFLDFFFLSFLSFSQAPVHFFPSQ